VLSVVIPAFNEADNLEPVVHETLGALAQDPLTPSFELIVVNDGSTDGTAAVADRLASAHANVVVVHHPVNRGFGAALKTGFAATRGQYVSLITADGEVAPDQVTALLRDIGDAGMILGRRERNVTAYREVVTFSMNVLMWLLLGFVPKAAGIYVVRGDLVRRMSLQSDTGLANLEIQLYCREWGFPIAWGVTHVRPRLSGESKVLNARTMFRTFCEMAKLRLALRRRRSARADAQEAREAK
jgi:glycosyltransferase involved in cell wall biosynthesis